MSRALPPPHKGRHRTKLERLVDACQKTKGKFERKRFSMRHGRDCAQMVKYHAAKLGKSVPIPPAGAYTDAASAQAVLARLGVGSLAELWDRHFERIGHANALPGDVVQLPADPEESGDLVSFGAFAVYLGDGAIFGYHGDFPKGVTMRLLVDPLACWRVI